MSHSTRIRQSIKQGNNIFVYLIYQFVVALGLLLLAQLFFYLFNLRIFHIADFGEAMGIIWGNLRFGCATLAVVLGPYFIVNLLPIKMRWNTLFRRVVELLLYYVPLVVVIAVDIIDLIYFQFTYRRIGADIFGYLGVGGDMDSLLLLFVKSYWYAFLLFAALMMLMVWVSIRNHLGDRRDMVSYWRRDLVGLFVAAVILLVMARGGLGLRMLQLNDVADHCQPKNGPLVSNTAYNILRTVCLDDTQTLLETAGIDTNGEYSASIDSRMYMPYVADSAALPLRRLPDSTNVVLIILESFSQEYMGCYNPNVEVSYTPFLDSLSKHSLLFDGRSNGKKSIESMPALLASMPTLTETPFSLSPYCNDSLPSLPRMLSKNGYTTAFFHGGYNGTMGFDGFCQKMGIEKYYGMDEYLQSPYGDEGNKDNVWGIYDEPFLQYMTHCLDSMCQPFFVAAFTLSSHHPYVMPKQYEGVFPQGSHPLLPMVAYSDHALRLFFEMAQRQKWYDHTLFIITGDHPGQGLSSQYNDYDGWYSTPMIFFYPADSSMTGVSPRLMPQTDVFPTVADMLGIQDTFECMGTSAVRTPLNGEQVVYGSGYYLRVSNDIITPTTHSIAVIEGSHRAGRHIDVEALRRYLRSYVKRNDMASNSTNR